MGTLRIQGTIDISQFWPTGSADADTTKIKLAVGTNSFKFKKDGKKSFSVTRVFDDAISKGQGSKPAINTSKKDGTKTITVRLQGVDAAELHYRAAPLKGSSSVSKEERAKFNSINEERRQYFAESATVALAKYLKQYANSKGMVSATFETNVDSPTEVVDTYGRFIGNIKVAQGTDINLWLVENGWGFPAFYTSMTAMEMKVYLAAWAKGKSKKNRLGKAFSKDANNFDWDLLYRRPSKDIAFTIGDDKGKVLMPKIFRRQTTWMVSKKAKIIPRSTNFHSYLQKTPDQLVLLSDLLSQGIHASNVYSLHDFVSGKNLISKNSEELVFKEKPSVLVNSKGKKITEW
jgi:endonuclease YncB( thermonuclease family)